MTQQANYPSAQPNGLGNGTRENASALKGRDWSTRMHSSVRDGLMTDIAALQAAWATGDEHPGRCPGLRDDGPLGQSWNGGQAALCRGSQRSASGKNGDGRKKSKKASGSSKERGAIIIRTAAANIPGLGTIVAGGGIIVGSGGIIIGVPATNIRAGAAIIGGAGIIMAGGGIFVGSAGIITAAGKTIAGKRAVNVAAVVVNVAEVAGMMGERRGVDPAVSSKPLSGVEEAFAFRLGEALRLRPWSGIGEGRDVSPNGQAGCRLSPDFKMHAAAE